MAADPEDEDYRAMLANVLGKKLVAHPDLADDLVALLGGFDVVQEMTARAGGAIVRAAQKATGGRVRQTMTAEGEGSGIYDAEQTAGLERRHPRICKRIHECEAAYSWFGE